MSRTKRNTIDPADLNHKIKFYRQHTTIGPYGEQTVETLAVSPQPDSGVWAMKKSDLSFSQFALQAGITMENGDCIFTIRKYADLEPAKDLVIHELYADRWYTIAGFVEQGEPARFWRIAASRKENFSPLVL